METTQPKRFVVPSLVVSHFHINPGETVADLGAGNGYFLSELVAAVGEEGVVYACDIQRPLIESLGDQARTYPDGVVRPIWGDLEQKNGSKIATDTVDRAIMVNILFQIQDKSAAVAEIQRLVRPGGKVFVVDWTEPWGGLGPREDMVCSEEEAVRHFEQAGLVLENTFPSGEHHYGLAFRNA